ncbi:phosphate ABC transporter substrate-binding protein [Massilia sp. PAMC28688]|uniref:phosphate ABC transporter substrate-binding protein n=1 Tax=Massilia sp. PAMC28688 TaxID=2861283 RepID=UPI001C628652|nr:phosphate ABC transporter substrate-binding protein [Massilia sp. PAMC28688]QYF93775.1 phosphate ABC transporter substrate-binding protein [Massilia sp. PAMC28688]
MRTSTMHYLAAIVLGACAVQSAAAAGELVVIVSAKSAVGTLKPEQVSDIFLGQMATFPGGLEAVALDQNIGSPERDEFYYKLTAKTRPLVKAHWTKMIFTGRGQPPREIGDSAAVRKKVAENPSLIGYIDKAALDASVKAVLLIR